MTTKSGPEERISALYSKAVGEPPRRITEGAVASILEATTRPKAAPAPPAARRLALGAAALATGVAAVALLRPAGEEPGVEDKLELAQLDLELLEELELCRDLETLELLEMLEEVENG